MEENLKVYKRKEISDIVKFLNELNGMWIRVSGGISLSRRRNIFFIKIEGKK